MNTISIKISKLIIIRFYVTMSNPAARKKIKSTNNINVMSCYLIILSEFQRKRQCSTKISIIMWAANLQQTNIFYFACCQAQIAQYKVWFVCQCVNFLNGLYSFALFQFIKILSGVKALCLFVVVYLYVISGY